MNMNLSDLSDDEHQARQRLIKMCEDIALEYGDIDTEGDE